MIATAMLSNNQMATAILGTVLPEVLDRQDVSFIGCCCPVSPPLLILAHSE